MKAFKALLTAGFLVALPIGCSTTKDKEQMLSAAGFKMVPADTPEKEAHLNSLPAGQITTVVRDGTLYYAFPDAKKKMLYVGKQEQYQAYQKLSLQKQIAEEQLDAASISENATWAAWGHGAW